MHCRACRRSCRYLLASTHVPVCGRTPYDNSWAIAVRCEYPCGEGGEAWSASGLGTPGGGARARGTTTAPASALRTRGGSRVPVVLRLSVLDQDPYTFAEAASPRSQQQVSAGEPWWRVLCQKGVCAGTMRMVSSQLTLLFGSAASASLTTRVSTTRLLTPKLHFTGRVALWCRRLAAGWQQAWPSRCA